MAKEIAKASQNELTWKHKIGYAAGDAGGCADSAAEPCAG